MRAILCFGLFFGWIEKPANHKISKSTAIAPANASRVCGSWLRASATWRWFIVKYSLLAEATQFCKGRRQKRLVVSYPQFQTVNSIITGLIYSEKKAPRVKTNILIEIKVRPRCRIVRSGAEASWKFDSFDFIRIQYKRKTYLSCFFYQYVSFHSVFKQYVPCCGGHSI